MKCDVFHFFFAIGLIAGIAQAQPRYAVHNLGSLGGQESRAFAINQQGHVVGESKTDQRDIHAFLWTPDDKMIDLGTLGGKTSRAYDLNQNDVVVGESQDAQHRNSAFFWSKESGITNLSVAENAKDSVASAINDREQIAGVVETVGGTCAVLWDTPKKTATPVTATNVVSAAKDINEHGAIAGQSEWPRGQNNSARAFLFQNSVASSLIELPEGQSSAALAMNDRGQIVGCFETGQGQTQAYLYDPDDGFRRIDTMNNVYSAAYGLNNHGHVVGVFFNNPDADDHAFLYINGEMHDLNDLIETDDDWLLLEAWDINDAGQIVGYGLYNGFERAFLLVPQEASTHTASNLQRANIVSPENNTVLAEPAEITIEADVGATGKIHRLVFYANETVLGSVEEAPYTFTWKSVPAGCYDLRVKTIDALGEFRYSERVRIDVLPVKEEAEKATAEEAEPATNEFVPALRGTFP